MRFKGWAADQNIAFGVGRRLSAHSGSVTAFNELMGTHSGVCADSVLGLTVSRLFRPLQSPHDLLPSRRFAHAFLAHNALLFVDWGI